MELSERKYRFLFLSVASSTLFLHDADYVSSCKLENNQVKKGKKGTLHHDFLQLRQKKCEVILIWESQESSMTLRSHFK